MLNKKRALTAAVLLSCSFFMAPYYAHAEEEEGVSDCGHGHSYMEVNIDSPASSPYTYKFDIYTATTHPEPHWRGEYQLDDNDEYILDANGEKIKVYTSYRDFFAGEEQAFSKSIAYIHNMVQPSPTETVPVIKLELLPDQDANAAAESETYITFNDNGKPVQISDSKLAAVLQGKYQPEDADAEPVANVKVNLAPPGTSWYIDKFPVLPSNGTNSDYYGTITHEMFHALGLGKYISEDTSGKVTFGTSANYGHNQSMAVFNKYEMGIRDAFGRVAYYSAAYDQNSGNTTYTYYDESPIKPNDENDWSRISGELISRTIVPISLAKFKDSTFVKEPDKFYVLQGDDVGTNSGTYFTGENVKKVLTTYNNTTNSYELASIAWPDGSTAPPVPGLPLNGYESDDGTPPELSHIELQNVNMSHQAYRNWCSFTEAELALMQDLGYNIDRSKYFGKSIYNSGTESTPFTYTNDNVFNSDQMHSIGLHVYGSYVDVTQNANASINANGDYGIGIRVDGVGNKVTIDSNISANGEGGNGLLVAYGKDHNITLNAGKTIEATGTDGVAARFDFGSNELGDFYGYRGSYINTSYTSQEELDAMEAESPGSTEGMQVGWREITEEHLPEALKGALVNVFNVAGTLKGSKAAIYISPNALVKNINILQGANIQGDIISDWNPNEIIYQNEDNRTLAPMLPEGEGLTNLNINTNLRFNNDIIGGHSLVINLAEDKTFTTQTQAEVTSVILLSDEYSGSGRSTASNQTIAVHAINLASNATFAANADLTVGNGAGTITLADNAIFSNNGTLNTLLFGNNAGTQFAGNGTANITGTVNATLAPGYYGADTVVNWLAEGSNTNITQNITDITWDDPENILSSPIFSNIDITFDSGEIHLLATRASNAYSQYADDPISADIAKAFDLNAGTVTGDAQNLVAAIDFSEDGIARNQNMKKLNPNVFGSSAQATLSAHSMMNNLNMLGCFSNNVPLARTSGGRGPAANAAPKYNSWRNIVMPFSAYTDQHNGSKGYTNHNSGVIGAMERTLENGLTHGYHAAVNHQSTSDSGSQIKGEGLYFGTQASYAPATWSGWSIFGSARLGLEQMRSHRRVYISDSLAPYYGTADADWTGYSGSFNIGAALTKEHGVVKSGPFAALDYSFAHRPSVHEDGGAIRTNLESATYDSLRTQLGYRLTTKPKALDSYDSTNWQAHASVAWNHELLSDNGSTSYQLTDLPGVTITDKAETYGRDSMSIAAGVIFKTPNRLDVGLTLGSDIYRHGGSSIYGKMNFEWKF